MRLYPSLHALVFACLMLVVPATAQATIYQFRANTTLEVLATLEIASPPATSEDSWESTDPADMISLFLDDATFGLGTGDVLLLPQMGYIGYRIESLSGFDLGGDTSFQDNTPGGAAGGVSDFFQLGFSDGAGADSIESFANGAFVSGDWDVVPEPSTAVLLGLGLLALGRSRRRLD